MLTRFDNFLNSIAMYRLVLYCLCGLVSTALALSLFGLLPYSVWALGGSLSVLLAVGFVMKIVLGWAYKLPVNFESTLITTLILFFVLAVPAKPSDYIGLGIGVVVALVSKYVINWRGAHIFNPAAFGVLVVSLTGLAPAAWWVATPVLLPFVALVGVLILRKTRQFSLFFAFAGAAMLTLFLNDVSPLNALISYPLVFLGVIMLTEPATMPSNFRHRIVFGLVVGGIFGSMINLGFISSEPHVALLIGNLLGFILTQRNAQLLNFVRHSQLSPTMYEFAFEAPRKMSFTSGQYFAWTLDKVGFDARGNRRSFTIASSPRENELKLGVKFYEPSSQFKKTLLGLKKGDHIHISALAGDFVMPRDTNKKLLFIAGGIGVTPFRSMVKDLVLTKQKRDIILFYFANNETEILYKDVWQEAKQMGVKVAGLTNRQKLDENLLKKYAPDFKERVFYLSGPPPMVKGYKKALRTLGIPANHIHTDYFSGY